MFRFISFSIGLSIGFIVNVASAETLQLFGCPPATPCVAGLFQVNGIGTGNPVPGAALGGLSVSINRVGEAGLSVSPVFGFWELSFVT